MPGRVSQTDVIHPFPIPRKPKIWYAGAPDVRPRERSTEARGKGLEEKNEDYLTKAEEETLLALARTTLEVYVRTGERPDVDDFELTETLHKFRGAFVTLRKGGQLRGCIGYTSCTKPLAVAVRDSAVSSAGADPRFAPVTPEELDEVSVEVSALAEGDTPDTPFKRLANTKDIVIGRDGLYLENEPGSGGLLLPQVAVEQGWTVGEFLSALCRKAGVRDGAWKEPGTTLYRFSAQVFGERDEADA